LVFKVSRGSQQILIVAITDRTVATAKM